MLPREKLLIDTMMDKTQAVILKKGEFQYYEEYITKTFDDLGLRSFLCKDRTARHER